MSGEMTDKQRTAMAALQAARASGTGLSAYARTHGLNERQVHDSISALRRRGALPPADRSRSRKAAFVAVRVGDSQGSSSAMTPAPRTGMVCRLVHASGLIVECGEWPTATVLKSLMSGPRDAAS